MAVFGDGLENVIRGFSPHERLGVLVPLVDPRADVGFELGGCQTWRVVFRRIE